MTVSVEMLTDAVTKDSDAAIDRVSTLRAKNFSYTSHIINKKTNTRCYPNVTRFA